MNNRRISFGWYLVAILVVVGVGYAIVVRNRAAQVVNLPTDGGAIETVITDEVAQMLLVVSDGEDINTIKTEINKTDLSDVTAELEAMAAEVEKNE